MIYSVGLQLRWNPDTIDSLFLDSQDHFGLKYWYWNIVKYSKQLKEAATGKKK